MAFRRAFREYAAAQGLGGLIESPSPMVLTPPQSPTDVYLAAHPPTAPSSSGVDQLLAALALSGQQTAAMPAQPQAPAPGPDPVAQFVAQTEAMRAGTHDPTIAIPEQALRSVATGAQIPLAAADVPRQMKTASDADAFVADATSAGDWSTILTVMNNLGAVANPIGFWQSRTDMEKQIVPDEIANVGGSLEDRIAAYAAYMNAQPPQVQQAVRDQFQNWINSKRQETYTETGDLKEYINFEEWQALNFDKALYVYLNGWQKPAADIPTPSGGVMTPQTNENPVFTGGQAVWEAYVNELDPAQRLLVDIDPRHDPTVLAGLVGGVTRLGAKGAAKLGIKGATTAARVAQGVDIASDIPFAGARLINPADRGIATSIGRAAAGAPGVGPVVRATDTAARRASGGFGRVMSRIGAREDPRNVAVREQEKMVSENIGLLPRATTPPETAPGTTVPPGFVPDPAAAARTVANAQVTTFDEAERAAQRQRMARYTPPTQHPNVAIGDWGTASDGVRAAYYSDVVRIRPNQVAVEGRPHNTFDVEVWNRETGQFDVAARHVVDATTTRESALRRARKDAMGTAVSTAEAEFTEVGAGLPQGQYVTEWEPEELMDLMGMVDDPRIRASGVPGQDMDTLRDKLAAALSDETVAPDATYAVTMDDNDLDTIRGMLEAAGELPMQTRIEPPTPAIDALPPALGPGEPPVERFPRISRPPSPPIDEPIPLPGRPFTPPLEAPTPQPGVGAGTRGMAAPEAAVDTGSFRGPENLPTTLQPVEPEAPAGLPAANITPPETTPATVRLGGDGGKGTGITPLAFDHLREVARKAGDDDLVSALESFTRPGNRPRFGELTVDQSNRLRTLVDAELPNFPDTAATRAGGETRRSIRRGLKTLATDLGPEQISAPPPVRPDVSPPPISPDARRAVTLTGKVKIDTLARDDVPPDLRARLDAAPTRNRGRGAAVDVEITQADLDYLNGLRGGNFRRDMPRINREFEAATPVAPTPTPPTPPEQPRFPTETLNATARRLQEEKGLTQRPIPGEAAPVEVAPEATPPPPRQATVDEAVSTPTQELRDKMLRQQYPDRPIAYDLGDGRYQLLDLDVPSGISTSARFSARKTVPSFTGTREEILANAPNAVFINPREGFRALGPDNVVIPPAGTTSDYSVGIWDAPSKERVSHAPTSPEGIGDVLTPFRQAITKTVKDAALPPTVAAQIEDDLDEAAREFLSITPAMTGDGPAHEIETALALSDRILRSMEEGFADTEGWQGSFPEFNYGAGRPIAQDPRLDFDAVLRGVFGSTRQSKLGTRGFETAEAREAGGRTAQTTGAGAVVRELTDRAERAASRGDAAEADQLRRLLGEIDTLRRRYVDLIQKTTTTDYYGGVPAPVVGGIKKALAPLGRFIRDTAQGAPQPTPGAERFSPTAASTMDLMSQDSRAAAQVQWANHPEFGNQYDEATGTTKPGLDSFTVLNEVRNQARVDQEEYKALLAAGGVNPKPKWRKINGVRRDVSLDKARNESPTQKAVRERNTRVRELEAKYKYALPTAQTLDQVSLDALATNRFLREYLIEQGMIKEGESPTHWLANLGRWMVGLHRDLGSASSQLALHDPTNFRYMAMNFFGNPALVAMKYPKAALRTLTGASFRTAYARNTEGTISPVAKILRMNGEAMTGAEIFLARHGTAQSREVRISDKFAHERGARGVRELMNRLGIGHMAVGNKTAADIAIPFENTARKNVGIESHQREAAAWARGEERIAEAWQDYRPAIFGELTRAGLSEDALRTMERGLPKDISSFELYDGVYRVAQSAGKSAGESDHLARRAYDIWRTPEQTAIHNQAVSDIKGPMPLNRRTPLDEKLGSLMPFTFWNTRITDHLLRQLYASPWRMAAFDRYQDWAENYQNDNPNLPSYLRGYINLVATPFGPFLAANPAALFLVGAFMNDQAGQDGVNKSTWDEIQDSVGQALGWSPMPHLQFLAQALGYSKDKAVRLPIIMPPTIKAFGAGIDLLSALSGGSGGLPVNQMFWTWASNTVNDLAVKFMPGSEITNLRDPDLARQSPVHAEIVRAHPELLAAVEQAASDEEREVALDALNDAFNEDSDIYREAFTNAAAAKAFTQSINMVTPILTRAVNPVVPELAAAMDEEAQVNEARNAAIADVEATAAGLPPTVPLGTTATAPGVQPVGTADWRTDPRWANHLTGGPAPDVQYADDRETLYLANDLIGGTEDLRRIAAVETKYHSIGTPEEKQAYSDWLAIAYGTPERTVDMGGGRVYAPADVLALPEEERKMLADEWVMTHATLAGQPLVPLVESYRMKRDQFVANNPEWAAYDTWRDNLQSMVDSGMYPSILDWGRQEAARNPQFKRALMDDVEYRLASGEYDEGQAEARVKSIGAFLAAQGIQKNVTDPAAIANPAATAGGVGGMSQDQLFATIQAAMNTGGGYNPAETIRQDLQAYSRDLAVVNTFLNSIGMAGSFADASPSMKQMFAPLLSQYGIPMPELGADTKAYLAWAQSNPGGTAEDFLLNRQQQQLQIMTSGLPTPIPVSP